MCHVICGCKYMYEYRSLVLGFDCRPCNCDRRSLYSVGFQSVTMANRHLSSSFSCQITSYGIEHEHIQTSIRPLTLTLLCATPSSQASRAAWLTIILHAGVKGRVDQTWFIWQEGHSSRSGAIIGQGGNGEFWGAVSAFALLRASLSVCWEPIVRGSFTPTHMKNKMSVANSNYKVAAIITRRVHKLMTLMMF